MPLSYFPEMMPQARGDQVMAPTPAGLESQRQVKPWTPMRAKGDDGQRKEQQARGEGANEKGRAGSKGQADEGCEK